MTSILHNSNENSLIERDLNKLELAELKKSEKAQKLVAEQYVDSLLAFIFYYLCFFLYLSRKFLLFLLIDQYSSH